MSDSKPRSRRRWAVAAVAPVVIVALGVYVASPRDSASSLANMTSEASYLSGLPPELVDELLSIPAARETLSLEQPGSQFEMLAQAMVMNLAFCRDLHALYNQWLATGRARPIAPLLSPDQPLEPTYSTWPDHVADYQRRIQSGEVTRLRDGLTADGSCGHWVPATPGQPNGPTIADVVAGKA